MLLTSWIRALRQSFTRHRLSRARRKQAESRRKLVTSRQLHLAEILEERSLLSIKPLVIDINALTGTNVFTSTASTPGINITNSLLDPNNDGISDYDDLLIGASQSSTFESTIISGAGIGIRINLSNLMGLNHIAIDNVFITAGANQQGISITLDNVALQSLAVDQTNVTPAATGTGGTGLDINLKNMASTTGVDVSIQNSNIRSGSTSLNGVNVTLESVSRATHIGELTLSDSTVEGFAVSTSANSTLYATIDQASVRNSRIQDGAANPNARGITYTLNRTVVNDLRIEDNLRLRNVAVTTTNSPLRTVSISDNTNFSVGGFVATDAIRDAIRINASSTNAVGTQRSDVTNLRIVNNTITGSLANTNAVNGIVLNLNDSNLGDYATPYAGARIAGNTISNLSGTVNSPAAAISVTATATATFVANNGGRPVLLDFDGDGTANDTNGITQNLLSNNNGRGIVVVGQPDTSFLADITSNSVLGGAAPNRREGVLINVAVRPTLLTADSFSLNFSDNTIDRSQGSAVSLTMQDSAVGSFVIQNNEITNATAFPFASTITATTPNGLSVVLEGANTSQEATNLLRSSVIQNNFIGVTRPTVANPTGTPGQNSANGIFINTQEASVVQDLQILNNTIRNNGTQDVNAGLQFLREDKSMLVATAVGERAVTISGNTIGENRNGMILDGRNGSIDLLDFDISNNFIGTDATGTDIGNTGDGILLRAQADARMLVDIADNQIRFNSGNGINLDDVFVSFTTDKRQIGGTWLRNTISDNTANGILVQGRHGLFDEATSIATPLLIGVEGEGNILQNNGGNGIRVARNDARPATGQIGITDNLIFQNGSSGIFARSPDERMAIRSNQIEANSGKGIDLEGFGPFGGVLAGRFDASIRDNVVTSQSNGVERGDGVELTLFNPINGAGTAVMSVLATNNFIDSNEGRGVELLNLGSGAMQVHFGDGTLQGRNTVVGNNEEGFYIVNSTDVTQPQDAIDSTPGTTNGVTSNGNALFTPDMMINFDRNLIQDNGLGLVTLGAGAGGSGLVVRAGSASATGLAFAGSDNSFAATYAGEVGANNGDPTSGNGRINMRVTNNQFEGNFGNDFVVDPYISNNQNDANFQTQGSWDSGVPVFQIGRIEHDPLVRMNLVFTGNSGNGIDVTRSIPAYSNNEANFKSRTSNHSPGPGGPFGSGTRLRSIIRLGDDGVPVAPTVGFSFVYPDFDFSGASTLRVEAGFDRSGTTAGFQFYNPTAPGPGSEDNFDDNTNWSIVPLGTFSYPDVDSPTQLTADVVDFTTPRSTTPGVVQIDFTEYVRNVDIGDFRLLRNGVVIPLESAPGVPLAVAPVLSSEDPNHPGAFRSFTIDLSVPTNVSGSYELQVLAVDNSNPLFSPIEDVVTQLSGQGNTLTRIVDGNGVLQDYTVTHLFTIDSTAPSATVGPITPDPRNSAAGIVTINFNEDVTGVDIADFELYRNDGVTTQSVVLGSISVTQISPSQYTLNLNQLTGAPGTYELRLVSTDTNTPILDLAGNLVADNVAPGIASSDTWLVDTTLPFVTSIADTLLTTSIASPVNAHPGSVIINFSEAVSGLDNSDFTLLRTNTDGTVTKIDLSSSITFPLFQLAANQYELNLVALASTAGTYSLSINPLNSGIVDTAGNAFLTSSSESWVLDVAAPLADIVDVAPDPRQTPVDALNTIFSEKVNGVNLADASDQYVLAFDDGTTATAGSISDATNSGPIVVTSTSHGLANGDQVTIYGVVGNTNTNGVFTVQNVTTNTFELTGSMGNGIYTGGGRWVRTVSLAGLTVSQQTTTRFVLNLSSVTLNQGTYILSLLADGTITDDAGNAVGPATGQFNVAAQDIWTNGPDAAPTGAITPITSPRGTNAGIITVTFSEPLEKISGNSPVDFKDFRLTRGATTISLASVPIQQIGPTTYTLDLSAAGLTDVDGTYTLQLLNTDTSGASASPLRDMTGNLLSDDSDPLTAVGVASQITWVKDAALSGPQVTSFRDVQRNNTLGSITKLREVQTLEINFTDDVIGVDLTDASKNFLLTRQATGGVPIPVSLDGIAVQQVTARQYRITLSTLTGTDGTYRFTVLANGLIKNATTLVDLKNPQTATWTKDGVMRPSTVGDSTDSNQGNEVVGGGSNYSLRQAIQEANALAGDDVIELGAGTYTLSLAGVQEDLAAVGDLDIRQNLVIRGKGVGVTVIDATALANQLTATNRDRLFQILAGVTVTIQGVTIQKGAVTGSEDGGAIRNAGNLTILDSLIQNNTSQDDAGAINNTGTLTIDRTTISGNTAVATGGAIRNAGTLLINNSTLSNNRTTGSSGFGGALMNVASFSATLENVTVSTNTAQNAAGGGIRNDGTLRLINDTIAFNRSLTAGAGLSRNLGTVTIGNTIVSDNTLTNAGATASDVAGAFVSIGGNIVRTVGTATGFNVALGDQFVNPNLQPLGNNGGPTQTHALLFNSPAIDRGLNANVTNQDVNSSLDQRGALRFLDGPAAGINAVDVGAVEFGTFFVNTTDDSPDVSALVGVADGLAEDGLRQTSLRAAIMESNLLAGESAIMLDGQIYSLKRLAPDTTAPVVASITGVPLAPITTGGVGVVTITFSERVAGFDLAHITLTRGGVPVALSATTFQLTKVSDLVYRIENRADIAAGVTNTGLASITQTNGLYSLTISPTANVSVNGVPTPTNIRDIENNLLDATNASVNWVRGTDTFAPSVAITPATITNQFIQNAGTVTVTFSERVTGVSANNFTLTRNGVAVTGLVVTPVTDNNFGGRTVVTLNLQTLTALDGNYVLTFNPTVGANITIRDTANNNLPAGTITRAWTKADALRFEPINDPRVNEVTSLRLQFTERVAGVRLEDFTLTFDDGSGIGPQPVDLSLATLATVGAVTAVPGFGNAAEQWELTFANKEAARDGVYVLSFDGLTNGNQLVTTATTATLTDPFTQTIATLSFTIGEDQSRIGDLDIFSTAGRVRIFGKGKDTSTTVLGTTQARTVIDGNLTDRLFDLDVGTDVSISGVEMVNGRVVYERSGGAFRNFGTLTLNDNDVLSSFADGNGGAIYNAAPFGQRVAVTDTLQQATLATDNVLTLTNVAAFPITTPFVILVDSEQIQVTAVNVATGQFTVSRGFNGTTATAHAANTTVTLLSLTTINRSNLQSNLAGSATSGSQFGKGGAIYNENGAVTINEGTYSANAAVTDGGAIYNGNQATASLLSTTFTGNLSGRDGGAIYNNDTATLSIRSSTLSNNRADATVNGVTSDTNGDGGAIYNETSATLLLDDSLLQNNMARNGGALYNDDGTLVLNRDTFGVNSALENGGAIFNTSGGSLTLNQGLFTTNIASNNGGAIQNFGSLMVQNVAGTGTQFLSNEAGNDGGAIFNQDGVVDVSTATFTLNRSLGDAGVIFNGGDGTLTISRSAFDRNSADGNGGALVNDDFAQITIDEVTFSNNSADGDGGAIYNNSEFTSGSILSLMIDDTTLNNNSAERGGAIFNTSFGGLTLTNSTLSANTAVTNGGGLANFGTASLLNDTLYLNDVAVGGEGAGIANNIGGTPPFGVATLKNTLVAGGSNAADLADGAIAFGESSFLDGGHNLIGNIGAVTAFGVVAAPVNGNLVGDSLTPLNPQLDTLRDNGGPTLTHALLFGSPARDAGDNFAVTLNDQRGLNRVFDGDGNGVATVDIGAFESGFVVNSFLDTVDENPGDGINADASGRSTLRAAIMEANARPGEDTIILGPGIFTLTLNGRSEDFRLNSAGNIASSSETGDLDILDDLNIIGAGTDLTFIDAAQIDRLFQIFPNVNLKLSNLTLQNGNATSTDFGGAIFNQGATTLDNVVVINSSAGRGGGVYNDTTGTLTVVDSLFRGNQAVQQGGAIYNDGSLSMTLTDIGAASHLAAAVTAAATTITVEDARAFPTSGPFVIQVDAERMLVTAVLGNQFTVTRGYNGTVAMSHTVSAFATLGNTANVHGGGLFNLGIADITQSSFSGNLAQSRGGGLYNAAVTGALTAAINAVQTTFTLTSVAGLPTTGTFTIQIDSEKMTVTNVNAATNTLTVTRGVAGTIAAAHAGGTLATSFGLNQTTIQQSTFLDNFASSRGAAIYNEEDLIIRNSTLSNNDSGTNAALGNSVSGRVTIENSTVVDNVAYRGGGLANSLIGSVTVHNTIVANNASTSISGVKAPNVRGTFSTAGNNFIGNNADSTGFVNNTNSDQVGSGTSPFDPVLKSLSDNGGPTLTHSARTGSPIVDTGNNTGGDPFDQRGAIRPTNADSDIGSVEQQVVHVTINNVSVREGNSGSTIMTFTLSLDQPSIQEIRVAYSLQGDTAFAGEDFLDVSGEVVFAPNQLNQTLEVVINGDTTIEPDEQFLVNLSIPADATFTPILDRTQAVGTIRSDDTGFRITNVNKVEQETGSAAQDYVFTVSVVGANLSPGQVVNVDYSIVDGSATIADGDYALVGAATGTLTFTAGSNGELPAGQTITVQVLGDEIVEANENFFVNLTSVDLPFEFDKSSGVGTIFNDDLSFTISNATANEGDPVSTVPMNFTVTLDRAVYVSGVNGVPTLATTTATVATASASATSGQDFNAVNTVLTFSGNTTSQVVSVGIIGDLRYEVPSETFQLQVAAGTINAVSDSNVVGFSTAGTGTIVDNDPPPDQYHIYTRFDTGLGMIRGRVDRIDSGVRTNLLDYDPTIAPPFTQFGDFGAVATDDLFVVDFNLYDDSNNFTQYDTTGVIDSAHVLGIGNPIPAGGLSVDGLNQVGADAVRFQGGGTFSTVIYNSIDAGSGSVSFDGSIVNYAGLEPLFDYTAADNRVFNAPVGASNDTINASASGGFISISGPTFESVTALAPATSLTLNGDGGNDTFLINSSDLAFTAGLTVNAGDGNDNVNLSGWALVSTVNGGIGNDTITGGSNADLIDGGDGNDTITGGLGNDTLFGGLGNDSIAAGSGDDFVDGGDDNDTIQGNDGIDTITGGSGNDNVDGGAGSETVDGGAGDDAVNGGDGDDTVLGNDGNDVISGGTGNDSLDGGFGDDLLTAVGGFDIPGNDTVNGGAGTDAVIVSLNVVFPDANVTLTDTQVVISGSSGPTVTLINVDNGIILDGPGNNRIDASTYTGSTSLFGSQGNDTLLGGLGSDLMFGGVGTDSISGGSGNDRAYGEDGNDTISGGSGDDSLEGGVGNDTVDAGAGNDSALGGAGNDNLTGGDGIDTLDGGDNNDTISGGDDGDSILGGAGLDLIHGDNGDDTIDAGDGDDTAFGDNGNDFVGGGAGNDTLQGNLGDDSVNGMDGNDTLDGNIGFDTLFGGSGDDSMISIEGNDLLDGQGGSKDTFTFEGDATIGDVFTITRAGNGNPLETPTGIGLARLNAGMSFTTIILGTEVFTLNMNGGNDLVTFGDLNGVLDLTVLNISGGDGNDTIDGSLSTSTTVSIKASMGLGNDSVQGGAAADTISGDVGNDTIIAGDGADSIVGSDGDDSLNGNGGVDTINGGLGHDSMWGGASGDSLIGLDGNDTIWGQGGNDTIDGGIGDDFLDGGYGNPSTTGSGNDSIRGGIGNDKIAGRDGLDTLFGDDGNDTITGGADNDRIDGGNGNDLAEGDDGNDTINGGAGNDFLLGGTGNDSILGGAGNDTLVGEAGKDTVDGQGGTDTVLGGNGTGTNTLEAGEKRIGEKINELFKITTARPSIFSELNF